MTKLIVEHIYRTIIDSTKYIQLKMSQHNAYMTKINILSIKNKEFSQLDVCVNLFIFILNLRVCAFMLICYTFNPILCIHASNNIDT